MSETLPDLQQYPVNTPERVVAEFLHAWAAQDWKRALKATQIDWRSRAGNDVGWLKRAYASRQLHKAEIASSVAGKLDLATWKISPAVLEHAVIAKVVVTVWTSTEATNAERKVIECMCLKESGPSNPSANGTWGVNPISMLRGLSAAKHEDLLRGIMGDVRKS